MVRKYKEHTRALALLKQGYNQSEVARKVGVNYRTVSAWKKNVMGNVEQKTDVLENISEGIKEIVTVLKSINEKL